MSEWWWFFLYMYVVDRNNQAEGILSRNSVWCCHHTPIYNNL